jgi:hypothetical protein
LGIGDWAQSPIPNPQSPIPNPHKIKNYFSNKIILNNLIDLIKYNNQIIIHIIKQITIIKK